MRKFFKLAGLVSLLGVATFVAPVYSGGQFTQENGSGVLIGESWDFNVALSNRTTGDGRTLILHYAQGTAADQIAAIQDAHDSWEGLIAVDYSDPGSNILPFAPSNGAGGGTPDGYNTHSFEFTLGCGGGLAVAPTVINTTTGQIVEADVFYEGTNCVNFSTDGTPTAQQIELEAVAVHEMGHFIGLCHSGEVDATMFPSIAPGTTASVTLEPDDLSSVTNLYGQDGGDSTVPTGGISGRVIDGNNSNDGKVCALVYAFSADEAPITLFSQAYVQVYSGSVVGDTAADNTSGPSSGSYTINGLPDGDWFLLLDPIGNIVQAAQITDWCFQASEAGFAQEWWNGVAESNAEGCLGCSLAVTVANGQITSGIDFITETGTCNTTENPESSCNDGVDNDCDGFADCDDSDCDTDPACSGGCMNNGECDDGNVCNGAETCNGGTCQGGTPLNCDDGQFCNGAETCDPGSGCQSGTAVDCDDGVGCTDDSCNEGTDSCDNVTNDGNCPDDGLFCNGTESCDAINDCVSSGDPCPGGTTCNESTDNCDPAACDNDGTCESGEDCNNCPNDCFSGSGASCGNDVCETADGEDCVICPQDCNGVQNGRPQNRYCCGDGDGQNPVGCGDARCSASGNTCSSTPATSSCCGDDICEGTENDVNCGIDCGCLTNGDCDDGDDCTTDTCSNFACQNSPLPDGSSCSSGGGDTCCGGSCVAITCDVNADCDDGDSCSTDTCQNAGTCSASCSNNFPGCGASDGCCGPGCTPSNDPDCPCVAKNDPCTTNAECCSGICKNNGRCR